MALILAAGVWVLAAATPAADLEIDDGIIVAHIVDDTVVPALEDAELRKLFAKDYDLEGSGVGPTLDSVEFLDHRYLVARGKTSEGSCATVARTLVLDEGALLLFRKDTTHTCTGDPCSSCSFTRNAENEITGCDCGDIAYDHMCNHTVSEG